MSIKNLMELNSENLEDVIHLMSNNELITTKSDLLRKIGSLGFEAHQDKSLVNTIFTEFKEVLSLLTKVSGELELRAETTLNKSMSK